MGVCEVAEVRRVGNVGLSTLAVGIIRCFGRCVARLTSSRFAMDFFGGRVSSGLLDRTTQPRAALPKLASGDHQACPPCMTGFCTYCVESVPPVNFFLRQPH